MNKWLKYAREEYAGGHYSRASFYARMSVAEDQKRTADALERIAGRQHLKVLEEIRDLARIGPPPVGEYAGRWDVHMLNKIADMATRAIEE